MWVILLEAFAALAMLGAIVWWTMFAGRRGGERRAGPAAPEPPLVAEADVVAPSRAAASGEATPPG